MTDPFDPVRAAIAASTAQLLLRAARLLDEAALARINAALGEDRIRPAHTRLLPHLSPEGIRPTELARRMGVTKQAVQPLLQDLVQWGVVELVVDPADGRARLARLTPQGGEAILHGLGVLRGFEDEVVARIGPPAWDAVRTGLIALLDVLADTPSSPNDAAR
jgi:DNA-binding MarR family transcriptional regulator